MENTRVDRPRGVPPTPLVCDSHRKAGGGGRWWAGALDPSPQPPVWGLPGGCFSSDSLLGSVRGDPASASSGEARTPQPPAGPRGSAQDLVFVDKHQSPGRKLGELRGGETRGAGHHLPCPRFVDGTAEDLRRTVTTGAQGQWWGGMAIWASGGPCSVGLLPGLPQVQKKLRQQVRPERWPCRTPSTMPPHQQGHTDTGWAPWDPLGP